MAEQLSTAEIKKYWKVFLGSIPFLVFFIVSAYLMVGIDSLCQYVGLPPIIEHNRAMFIVLTGPLLGILLTGQSAYCLIVRRNPPQKYIDWLWKYLLYLLVITLFAITPVFSIGGSMYLDYQGYTRCPTHNPSPFNRWQPVYAKSLEHCPELKTKTPRTKPRSSRHDNAIAAIH